MKTRTPEYEQTQLSKGARNGQRHVKKSAIGQPKSKRKEGTNMNEQDKNGKWDYVESRRNTAVVPAGVHPAPRESESRPVLPSLTSSRFIAEAEQLPTPFLRFRLKREGAREIVAAQLQRLRMAVEAGLKCERAAIDLQVEKVMAEIREERLGFLAHLGVREIERLRELALRKERIFVEWFGELQSRDMPEFMRAGLADRVMKRWDKEMNEIFKTDE